MSEKNPSIEELNLSDLLSLRVETKEKIHSITGYDSRSHAVRMALSIGGDTANLVDLLTASESRLMAMMGTSNLGLALRLARIEVKNEQSRLAAQGGSHPVGSIGVRPL